MKKQTMRIPALIVACLSAVVTFGALAQQAVPDAPQPQKKQAAKPPDPPPHDPAPPANDDNAFPEDVSKKAAESADPPAPAKNENAFPEDVSKKAAEGASPQQPKPSADNPFPEEQSKAAAKAAGQEEAPAPPLHDPARSRKDDEVGSFYLKTGDYQGALLRYQDATATDPTNVNAIFGLAESQRMLKKNTDAARNYELYLMIVPNGPKAKQALKALKEIQAGK